MVPTSVGSPWLGFVIDRERRLLKARKARFATRRLGESYDAYCRGLLSFAEFDARIRGWIAHAGHGDTWGLREHVLEAFILRSGDVPGKPPRG